MLTFKQCSDKDLKKDQKVFTKIDFSDVIPSPKDSRDYIAKNIIEKTDDILPEEYLAKSSPILNQGCVGSCVAHACSSALSNGELLVVDQYTRYSVGYIYANRQVTDHQKDGMYLRQALKQLNKEGDVYYEDFPYNKPYKLLKAIFKPMEAELDKKAAPHKIQNYYRCCSDDEVKRAVMLAGGVIITAPVYESFGRNATVPKPGEKNSGNHALLIIGWTKDNKWIIQNSWGKNWGYDGCLLMDFEYPIFEYWGITVNKANIDLNRIKDKPIKRFFSLLWKKINWIFIIFKNLFNKKKSN